MKVSSLSMATARLGGTMYEWKQLIIIWREKLLKTCPNNLKRYKKLHKAVEDLENALVRHAKTFFEVRV